MAVKFNKTSFTIEVDTVSAPIEAWLETQSELLDALQSEDDEMHANRIHYLNLLRCMMPDLETAKRMLITA